MEHRVVRRISFKVNCFVIVMCLHALPYSLPVELEFSLAMKTQVYFVWFLCFTSRSLAHIIFRHTAQFFFNSG